MRSERPRRRPRGSFRWEASSRPPPAARLVKRGAAVLLATRAREVAPAAAAVDQGRGAALEPLARRVSLKGEPAEAGSLWSIEATRTPLSMSTVLPLLARRTLTL